MHRLGKALAGATATATVLGVLGLTASAQAATVTKTSQPASRRPWR